MYPKMHVSLYVSKINETVRFYKDFFGTEPTKVKGDYAKFVLDEPALIISFIENPDRVQSNFGHLGFQVETQELMMKRLEDARSKFLVSKEEIGTACCYALQDKFWAEDPDGYQWEVYYFHEDVSFNDPHYQNQDAAVCCTPAETKVAEKQKVALAEVGEANDSCCTPDSGCC